MRFSYLGSVLRLSAEFFIFFYLYYFCLQLHLLFATVAAAEVYPSSSGKQAIKQAARIFGNDSGDQQQQGRDRVSKIREKQTSFIAASEFLFRARFWRERTHCTSCEEGGDRRSLRACLFVCLFVGMGSLAASLPSSLPPFPRPRRIVENNRFPRAFAFGGERPHKFSVPLPPSLSVTYTNKQQTCACTYFLSLCSRLRALLLLLLLRFFPWREQNSRRIVILAAHELFWRTGLVTASLRSAETQSQLREQCFVSQES